MTANPSLPITGLGGREDGGLFPAAMALLAFTAAVRGRDVDVVPFGGPPELTTWA